MLLTCSNAEMLRFLQLVETQPPPNGCWLWTGAYAGNQPRFSRPSNQPLNVLQARVSRSARVFIYTQWIGPIPTDRRHTLTALCKNTRCVNPEHLLLR